MNSWVGVELRHLAALSAVAEERSFRGAADRLGYVQSAVSQRIAQLEAAVGVRLVERSRGHKDVDLTEAGKALLRYAGRIDAQLAAAQTELHDLATDNGGGLKVGAYGGAAVRLLPPALARLARRRPETRVELREAGSDRELFDAVDSGSLDLAVAELPLEGGSFESLPILVDPLLALVPSGSRLARLRKPPALAELASEAFVLDTTWRLFDLVAAEFAAAGLELDVRFETTSAAAMQALVAAGLGISIAPRLDVDLHDPATTAIDLSSALPSRTLVCYWSPERRREELAPLLEAIGQAGQPRTEAPLGPVPLPRQRATPSAPPAAFSARRQRH